MTTTEAALRERVVRIVRSANLSGLRVGEAQEYIATALEAALSQPSPASSTAEEDYAAALAERIEREKSKGLSGFNLTLGEDGADPQEVARVTLAILDYASSSGEPASVAVEADDAFDLMKAFYLSDFYDPNAARPADNVQAAIAFTLDRIATAAPVAWTGSGSMMALKDGREGYIWPKRADAHPVPLYSALSKPTPVEAGEAERRAIARCLEIVRETGA